MLGDTFLEEVNGGIVMPSYDAGNGLYETTALHVNITYPCTKALSIEGAFWMEDAEVMLATSADPNDPTCAPVMPFPGPARHDSDDPGVRCPNTVERPLGYLRVLSVYHTSRESLCLSPLESEGDVALRIAAVYAAPLEARTVEGHPLYRLRMEIHTTGLPTGEGYLSVVFRTDGTRAGWVSAPSAGTRDLWTTSAEPGMVFDYGDEPDTYPTAMASLAISVLQANIVRYPIVEPQSAYPRGIAVSSRYRVLAKLASDPAPWSVETHKTAVYDAWPDYVDPDTVPSIYRNNHVHIAQVDANAPVRFRVEIVDGTPIESLELKPSRYEEMRQSQSHGEDWVEFEVAPDDVTKHVLVEINDPADSPYLNHGLMVFVNPLFTVPSGDNVLALPPGIIEPDHPAMDSNHRILINQRSRYNTIYIPMDTMVNGRIEITKPNVRVMGRGIIVGSRWPFPKSDPNWQEFYPITPDGERVVGILQANQGTFDGVMIVHPYHFCFGGGRISTNLKAFGWRYSSDGFYEVDVLKGCFTRVNDDHIYFCSSNRQIERNTHWGMNNGTIYQGGWGDNDSGPGGSRIFANNVVRGEWTADGGARQNNGIFGSVQQSTVDVSDVEFRDIRVDGQVCRFINFHMPGNRGTWSNFLFKDIWFEKPLGCPQGNGSADDPLDNYLLIDGSIQDFVFDNVVIGGRRLQELGDLEPLQQRNVSRITFR